MATPTNHRPPLNRLRKVLETLLSPLDGDPQRSWPEVVNRNMLSLLESDVAIFRLSETRPAWVDPAPDAASAREEYRKRYRALDPWARHVTRPGQAVIQPEETLLGPDFGRSTYYSEFLAPQGIHGYVGAQIGTTPGAHAHVGAYRMGGRRTEHRTARATELLEAVLPALTAGLRAWWATGGGGADFGRVIDELDAALLLAGPGGRTVHANRTLVSTVEARPHGARLREEMEAFARELTRARTGDEAELLAATREREFRTATAVFRIRGVTADAVVGPGGVLLVLDEVRPVSEPTVEASHEAEPGRDRFGLTPRELEVAGLLARGHTNRDVARDLGISENTAQTHTRRVLAKLGVSSRAAVHSTLHGDPGAVTPP